MRSVKKLDEIPCNSMINNGFNKIHYSDTFQVIIQSVNTIDALTTQIFIGPKWANGLMNIRNAIVKIFGLKTGSKEDMNITDYYPIGSRAVAFHVIDRNENEIVMGEDDKHLNFRTSVLMERNEELEIKISLITVVHFNNIFGRLYFLPVRPFHRLIIPALLKRLLKSAHT